MITITIPSESASRSKMQKKGWKCWAKWLSHVNSPANDGYAYEGEFTTVGTTVEAEVGDVLLHVDQSSSAGIGVLMLNKSGESFFKWIETAPSDGRKWCGPLAASSRRLLGMSREERIKYVAGFILDQPREKSLSDETRIYWEGVAKRTPEPKIDPVLETPTVPEEPPFLPSLRAIGGIVGILRVYGQGEQSLTPEMMSSLAEKLNGMHQELWNILVEKKG